MGEEDGEIKGVEDLLGEAGGVARETRGSPTWCFPILKSSQ
jgi:hypothetical protein